VGLAEIVVGVLPFELVRAALRLNTDPLAQPPDRSWCWPAGQKGGQPRPEPVWLSRSARARSATPPVAWLARQAATIKVKSLGRERRRKVLLLNRAEINAPLGGCYWAAEIWSRRSTKAWISPRLGWRERLSGVACSRELAHCPVSVGGPWALSRGPVRPC
jgi:hypothetical protein